MDSRRYWTKLRGRCRDYIERSRYGRTEAEIMAEFGDEAAEIIKQMLNVGSIEFDGDKSRYRLKERA